MTLVDEQLFNRYDAVKRTGKFDMFKDGVLIARMICATKSQYAYLLRNYKEIKKIFR